MVTGGATGIGRAVCQALAAKGMRVGVVYNSSEAAARSVAEGLPGAFVARADLADPAQVEALVKQLQEVAGRVDVLVNNAGYNRDAPIFSMKIDDYDAVAGLARGTWYLTKLVLRRFMLRTGGRIVNISSVVGHTGNAGQIPYTMVKAGLDALTRSLAQEMQGRDILVNSVAPGFIDTEMTAGLPDEVRTPDPGADPARPHGPTRGGGRGRGLPRHGRAATSPAASSTSTGGCTVAEPFAPLSGAQVLDLLPQQEPFRFVDEILEVDDDHIVARYTFRPDADFYRGHFPGNPITPGVLLIEAMAQTGVVALGIYLVARERGVEEVRRVLTVFTDVTAEFTGVVRPGDTVTISARKVFFRRMKLRAEVEMRKGDGSLVATATVAGMGIEGAA